MSRSGRAALVAAATSPAMVITLLAPAAGAAPASGSVQTAGAALLVVAEPGTSHAGSSARRLRDVGYPLIIGHRGASGYRPEHTLASYRLAIALGADFVEPDLVSTKDGVLVARHENDITGTTDVAAHPEFAGRKTTKTIDGAALTGWFTEDFTLRELKTLRAKERIPQVRPQNTAYDGLFEVPTLQEVIDLVRRESRRRNRPVGIYPETKHPTFFDSIGLSLEEPLVRTLRRNGLDRRTAQVFVQSFETSNLRELNRKTRVRLVQLINGSGAPYDLKAKGDPRTYADLITPAGLTDIATYADGIGPDKGRIVPRDATGKLLAPTTLVDDAHDAGLLVHPFTFRSENMFLPLNFRRVTDPTAYGNWLGEYSLFFRLGVDGLFSDNPDDALVAREALYSTSTSTSTSTSAKRAA